MAKTIVIKYKGETYTLGFNNKVVKRMESNGFTIDTDRPATMITELFRGAFQMYHRKTDFNLIDEIWLAQRKKDELLTALISMYSEAISYLMDEPEGDEDDGNPTWTVQG